MADLTILYFRLGHINYEQYDRICLIIKKNKKNLEFFHILEAWKSLCYVLIFLMING